MTASTDLKMPAAAPEFAPAELLDGLRAEFPILAKEVHGVPLVYLDNAATSQKPRFVLDRVAQYYGGENANIHRAVHVLAELATTAYEAARVHVRDFIGATDEREVIFVRGCTEGLNLVANSYGAHAISEGDEILVSEMEHHSNIVPWQLLAARTGARVLRIPVTDDGDIDLAAYGDLLGPRTKIVAVSHVSNALGSVNPVARLAQMAHDAGAIIVVDGAQGVPHGPVDVAALGADFYAFSGHKMYAPTGIGALWGRRELLEAMPPWQGGGDMIETVSFDGSTWSELPSKFEAGTPNIAGGIALGAAVEWMSRQPLETLWKHEAALCRYGVEALQAVPGLTLVGRPAHRQGVISFVMKGAHPHDVGTLVDRFGVAIRTGHHCAQPVMERLGVSATARASFAFYNTREEVDTLVKALHRVAEMFA